MAPVNPSESTIERMEKMQEKPPPSLVPTDDLTRLAGWCAYASGVAAVIGIAFLILFFTLGGIFGPLNDLAVVVQYTLMLPIALQVHRLVRPAAPRRSGIAAVAGLAGMLAVIVLQAMLVAGLMPFRWQIVLVVPAFLVVLAWFVVTGRLGRSTGLLPEGTLLHVLAGLYVGYPVWAVSFGRRLRTGDPTSPDNSVASSDPAI
jgi:hypothetical protein